MSGSSRVHRLDFRNRLGHEIVVLDRHQGQTEARHRGHLARPQPRRVHHVLGDDRSLRGHHLPGAVAARVGLQHRATAHDLRSAVSRALRERVGHAARVDVARGSPRTAPLSRRTDRESARATSLALRRATAARSPPGGPWSGTAQAPPCADRCARASLRRRDGSRHDRPVSASSFGYSSNEYRCSQVMVALAASAAVPPAACQVEPDVSSLRSRSRQSVQPALARW